MGRMRITYQKTKWFAQIKCYIDLILNNTNYFDYYKNRFVYITIYNPLFNGK